MTEWEWLRFKDETTVRAVVASNASARKWRLFAVACCYRVRSKFQFDWDMVELAEQLADGHGSVREAVRKLSFLCICDC